MREQETTETTTAEPDIIKTCRVIVAEHQYQEIDGMIVDAVTANLLTQVWDGLNEENRAKFAPLDLYRMVTLCWKLVK